MPPPPSTAALAARAVPETRTALYPVLGGLMLAVAVTGFWPQYYGPALGGEALAPRVAFWAIHVHAALFLGWLVAYFAQAALAWRGRTRLHRRLGPALAAYGFATAAFGVFAGFVISAHTVALGRPAERAAAFLLAPLSDMAMFAGFLAAAVAWRRQREVHAPLMFLASWSVAMVPFGRWLARHVSVQDPLRWQPAILGPLASVIAVVWLTRRRVHPVWLVGLLLFVLRANRRPLMDTEAWLTVGRALLRPFLPLLLVAVAGAQRGATAQTDATPSGPEPPPAAARVRA